MKREYQVFELVKSIYENDTTRPMGVWMWQNHIQWVVHKTKELAKKYRANEEFVVSAALLHDIADSQYERGHSDFDTQITSVTQRTRSITHSIQNSNIYLKSIRYM